MAQTASNPFTVQIVSAPPPLTASFQLTSVGGGASLPYTIGYAFQKGAFAGGTALTVDQGTAQIMVKRLWNDGSIKHAVVSGHVNLTGGVAQPVQINTGTPAGGATLTSASIQTAFSSITTTTSVQCGSIGTVALGTLVAAAPFRTWVSGPEMVECHYRAKVGSDATLVVWFHVRLYKSGRIWVRAICENGYLPTVTNADKAYVPTIKINDVVVYNNGGAALNHCGHTRFDAEGWIGGDPQITPKHNVAQLIATKLVPNYWKRNPSAGALNGLHQVYTQMTRAGWTQDQSNTGYQDEIGLLPLWDALYCTSGDPRAFNAVVTGARSLNSYGIVWRDPADNLPARPSQNVSISVFADGSGSPGWGTSNSLNWDLAHHGSGGYLAYLVTGDYYFLETLQHQASLCWLCNDKSHGLGTTRLLLLQSRAMAWSLRTVGELAAIGPSGSGTDAGTVSVTTDYAALLQNNMANWDAERQKPGQNPLGILYSYEVATGAYAPPNGVTATWQQNFAVQTVGHLSDMDPLSDLTSLIAVRDYYYRWPIGLLGTGGASNFCYNFASTYTIQVNSGIQTGDMTKCFTSWGAVYQANFGAPNAATCGAALGGGSGGDPASACTGYWGNLMPAIAHAVDHGASGAVEAFGRMTGATNWSTVENSGFDDIPIWGIVPRGQLGT